MEETTLLLALSLFVNLLLTAIGLTVMCLVRIGFLSTSIQQTISVNQLEKDKEQIIKTAKSDDPDEFMKNDDLHIRLSDEKSQVFHTKRCRVVKHSWSTLKDYRKCKFCASLG